MFAWITWENPVAIWWLILSSIALVNIVFMSWTWIYRYKHTTTNHLHKLWHHHENIIYFCAIYVVVCAFRSVMPRADVQRICLFDTWFSSVFVGRSVATIAELSFIIQWSIVLGFLGREIKSKLVQNISILILILISMAECFSWYAVIRTHYLGNSIEESLWGVSYSLITIAIICLLPKLKGSLKLAGIFSVIGCILYVAFMATVDVPMYIHRLIADNAANKPLLNLASGLLDLNTRWVVTHHIKDWKTEIPWQTLYFTFAVWVSIALCYVPLKSEKIKKYLI